MNNIQEVYPLTPMQQGMLFHSRLAPDSGVYVEQLSCRLDGALDPFVFEQAWQQVTDRHAILRTGFIGEALKEPVQAVHGSVPVRLYQEDWRGLSETEQAQSLEAFLERDRAQGFDLSKPPLFRLTLFRLGETAWRMVWTYHHILLDGWSMPILFNDVFTIASCLAWGQAPRLPPAQPFRDYLVWLRKQDTLAAQAYWRSSLAGIHAPTPLPADWAGERPRPKGARYQEVEQWLSQADTERLKTFARQQCLTLGTLIQAAWAVLLGLHARETDVVFGATVSGRPVDLIEAENRVGLFINTLPVRVHLPPEARVTDWLREVQTRLVEMRQYEYCALVDIQGWSEAPRDVPLFESLVVFENYPIQNGIQDVDFGLRLSDVRSFEQTNYPLNLIAGAADRLMLKIVYDTQQYLASGAKRLVDQLAQILFGFVDQPEGLLQDLPRMPDAEQRLTLGVWNQAETNYDLSQPVTVLFERQADRRPEAPALVYEDQMMTYAELEARSNQVAGFLRRKGVAPETLVAVCMPPGLELVTALLGILKAGGAYLPLDPSYPLERLEFMLEDSGSQLLITQAGLLADIDLHGLKRFNLDTGWRLITKRSQRRRPCPAQPDNLAYVIYTSGSTGRPKGVQLEHRGLTNLVQALTAIFDVRPESRLLQFASISFDASVSEIFTALAAGATLVLISPEARASVDRLAQVLQEKSVTVATFPPTLLALLDPQQHPGLETVVSAGEACSPQVARRWAPGRRFINGYGPTETTVAALYDILKQLPEGAASVPIGRPLPNTRVYVLDERQRPVPGGAPGELCVGGVSLARGYLNRPELTANKFIHDPFSPDPTARLYRTGDLVRWRPDGRVEFLGRLDEQVKLRGFRIELGEIEGVLSQHPDVVAAAVGVHPDGKSDAFEQRELVAYVVPQPGVSFTLGEIRAFLKTRLPDYMLPNALVCLDALPFLPNGKVDRRRLPAPDPGSEAGREIVAPRDLWEARLCQIWEEILNRHPVGVRDNFFDMGGHSLLVVRLAACVKERLGYEISLADFFQAPTVEEMAAHLRQADDPQQPRLMVPIHPGGTQPPLIFIHPSGGSVHWYTDLAKALGRDRPVYGFQMQGLQNGEGLHTRIEQMAQAYLLELRAFQPHGPYNLASWSMGVTIAYEMACQLAEAGEPVAFLGLLDQGPRLPAAEPEDDAEYLVQVFGEHVPVTVEELRQLPGEEQIPQVWKKARKAHFIYPEVSLEQFRGFIRALRTHTEAWRNYRPRPYPGKLTLFRAEDQDHLEDQADLGWGDLAAGGVQVYSVPGDHLTMIHPPHVKRLAEVMRACLDETSGVEAGSTSPPVMEERPLDGSYEGRPG